MLGPSGHAADLKLESPVMAVSTEQRSSASEFRPRGVRGAADWRKRLRREFLRLGPPDVSMYVDGRRGIVHVRFPEHADRISADVREALRLLQSLPDGAGAEATLNALSQS